jgi:acetyl esterase/lipase
MDRNFTPRLLPTVLLAGAALSWAGVPGAQAAVRIVRDVGYLEPERTEKLDLYLPDGTAVGPRPSVVIIHGGGFVAGDKADLREQEIAGAYAAAGYACASINYRLGPGSWPVNLHDCKNAVRFLRSRAAEYKIDPARIAVHGNSAGGYLALMVAFTADQAGFEPAGPYRGISDAVAAAIDFYGRPDLTSLTLPGPDGTPTDRPFASQALVAMLGCGPEQNPALWKAASPIAHVTPDSPPVLIAQGLSDAVNPYSQAVRLANTLRLYGVEHELVLLEGIAHGFDLEYWKGRPLPQDLRRTTLEFLGRHMQGAAH